METLVGFWSGKHDCSNQPLKAFDLDSQIRGKRPALQGVRAKICFFQIFPCSMFEFWIQLSTFVQTIRNKIV